MKRFQSSRLISKFCLFLISIISLCGIMTLTPAHAQLFPGLTEELCMANAYLTEDNHHSLPQGALNCTANDVEITEVVNPSLAECTPGEIITFNADVKVRTNANERYDTTFYLPLTEQSPQTVSIELAQNPNDLDFAYYCSLLLPMASEASAGMTYADLDLDRCADITKKFGNDTYTLVQESITMLCIDKDDDGQADFHYCAAWDNKERLNCTEIRDPVPGQVPNTKSKCNCDTLNIPIFIKPTPPLMTKTIIGSDNAVEPTGVFKYEIVITNTSQKSDIFVQTVHDIVRSSTDGTVFANFDLTGTVDSSMGNLTLLTQHQEHTCDTVLADVPGLQLTPSIPTVRCFVMMQVDDDNLPTGTDELYQDFIRALVWDKNDANVGDDNCDPTRPASAGGPLNPTGASCSDVKTVKIKDVTPFIDIDKFSISAAGLNWTCMAGTVGLDGKCSGAVYIEEPGGDVTFKLVITNTSTADPLTVTSLTDLVSGDGSLDLLTNISANSCDDALPIQLAIAGQTGDDFTCQFVRDVSGGLITVHNTVTVVAAEKNGHSEGNTAMANDGEDVTITDVAPTVVLLKQVRALAGPNDQAFGATAAVFEPEGTVIYRFTVTNTSPSGESIRLLSLTDAVLSGSRVTQTDGGTCVFDGSVTIPISGSGNPYLCTINATVTGEPDTPLHNTAYVTITDEESNLNSNTSMATVTFKDIPADGELIVNLSATVFVTIKNTSTFEAIKLTKLTLKGNNIVSSSGTDYNIINGGYGSDFNNDGLTYPSCDQPSVSSFETIAANAAYRCAFTVELLTDTDVLANMLGHPASGGLLEIAIEDFDGGIVDSAQARIFVHLVPPN